MHTILQSFKLLKGEVVLAGSFIDLEFSSNPLGFLFMTVDLTERIRNPLKLVIWSLMLKGRFSSSFAY